MASCAPSTYRCQATAPTSSSDTHPLSMWMSRSASTPRLSRPLGSMWPPFPSGREAPIAAASPASSADSRRRPDSTWPAPSSACRCPRPSLALETWPAAGRGAYRGGGPSRPPASCARSRPGHCHPPRPPPSRRAWRCSASRMTRLPSSGSSHGCSPAPPPPTPLSSSGRRRSRCHCPSRSSSRPTSARTDNCFRPPRAVSRAPLSSARRAMR
mmetsp:Transcript_1975/g.6530  ORF Transcript_1975/g.6530 Transcript_1975/m.6530 type:complete len:213 (+) Transcript_1975:1114-1752(+)